MKHVKRQLVPPPYYGFMYIRCENCGAARGLCSKTALNRYYCSACRVSSDMPPGLTPLFVNCECGKKFHYLTNMTDKTFDIPCLSCGSPVPTQYNAKTGMYETIRTFYARKKR